VVEDGIKRELTWNEYGMKRKSNISIKKLAISLVKKEYRGNQIYHSKSGLYRDGRGNIEGNTCLTQKSVYIIVEEVIGTQLII
jgi:hypothetical protein